MISKEQGKKLLELARTSLISSFLHDTIDLSRLKEEFSEKQGVFVTLKKDDQLRGCIGFPEPVYPLYDAVFKAARASAFDDPRFPEVEKDEVKHIQIEISVLTVPKKIDVKSFEEYLEKIKVGRDGLIIKLGLYSGLLLPQVPLDWDWDIKEYLENLCLKAGLPKNAWKEDGAKISSFQAQIFIEEKKEDEYSNL